MEPLCKGDRLQPLVDSAVQASITLGAVVESCFGPNGLDVLLESSDGHVSCCNCGCQLVASLALPHPVAAIITKSVKDYYQSTGDGSKKMLLILKGAMEEISSLRHGHSKIEVSRAFQWLNQVVIPVLTTRLRKSTLCRMATNPEELHVMLIRVAASSYLHRFGKEITRKISDIMSAFLCPLNASCNIRSTIHSIKKRVEFTRKNMSTLVISLPGHAVSHSRAIPGFLLDSDLVHPVMKWEEEGERRQLESVGRRLRSVLVLDWTDEQGSDLSCLASSQISVDLLSNLDTVVEGFSQQCLDSVRALKAADVRLLLCCGKVPPMARHQLRESEIMLIEMIEEDTLRLLAECCSTHPLPSVRLISETSAVSLSLSLVDIASKQYAFRRLSSPIVWLISYHRYLSLQLPPDRELCPVSVVLCAPTAGFCQRLQHQLTNALLVVAATLCHNEPPAAVVGGGAWEMALIRELKTYHHDHDIIKHSPKWSAITALQKGLLAVPHSLLTSSLPHHSHTVTHPMLTTLYTSTMMAKQSSDLPYMRVDCVNGTLRALDEEWQVLEPYSSQCHLLYGVLSLLSHLLRLDLVASARTPHPH